MDPLSIGILAGGAAIFTAFVKVFAHARERRLGKTKLWAISELPTAELGRIVGATRAIGPLLTAPLSGRPCLYWSVRVTVGDGRHGPRFRDESSDRPFELEDASGVATVDPVNVRALLATQRWTNGVLTAPTEAQLAFFAERNLSGGAIWNDYEEAIIETGETIAVIGFGARDATGRLRLASSPELPLLIADDPRVTHVDLPPARVRLER